MQIGLHPGGGHTWMFRRIAGPQVTMAAVVFGEVLDGEEAARVGLAFRCVDDDDLLAAAHDDGGPGGRAHRVSWSSPRSGRSPRWPTSPTTPTAVAAELEPQLWSTRQPWFAERLAALRTRISSRPS